MNPSSDTLEQFHERLRTADRELARLKGAEVTKSQLIAELRAIAKDWLRYSEALRSASAVAEDVLQSMDTAMQGLLQATNARTRSSSYRKRLEPLVTTFSDSVVVPVIRREGSPAQVAARQLIAEFTSLNSDEMAYADEASRCLASKCHRAAIIMLWAAGVARLHSGVEKLGYNAYNSAMDAVGQKKGAPYNRVSKMHVNSVPELQRTRDLDFLVLGMDLWKYDLQVFEELDRLLGIRNSAAHPGMMQPTAIDVQQFASKLNGYLFANVPL